MKFMFPYAVIVKLNMNGRKNTRIGVRARKGEMKEKYIPTNWQNPRATQLCINYYFEN